MKSHGRRPATRRPQSGPRTVMPRTPSRRTQPQRERVVRTRVARVNQKMVDRMVKLRQQGFSYDEIGDQVGCSERTVRRHTKGVSPRLVHAGDPKRIDLLTWVRSEHLRGKGPIKTQRTGDRRCHEKGARGSLETGPADQAATRTRPQDADRFLLQRALASRRAGDPVHAFHRADRKRVRPSKQGS